MKILHTSDWHIGRTFHGHSTLPNLKIVLAALVEVVRVNGVDAVVVSGDIFDSASPAAENYEVLTEALGDLRAAGATVVLTSGNHDSATRLGFQSGFAGFAGIHVITRHDQQLSPVTLVDEHGPVHFYGIPFLEPSLVRHHYPEATLRTHTDTLSFVMGRIRADIAARGGRSVVLSHCFAVGGQAGTTLPTIAGTEATDVERDITSGGLDFVPASVFDGPDYVALGHIHGQSTLTNRVRYSGAPLHYSFSEAGKPRGGWLVDLDENGLGEVLWVDLPIPRALTVLHGTLDELLADTTTGDNWISAVLTDQVRPMDAMRRLQARFPFCVTLEHRPEFDGSSAPSTYTERVRAKSDHEIVAGFLEYVRNGAGPNDLEQRLIAEVITAQRTAESGA
ncbi:MAG: exonuclease sbcCD subunit [Glaciihabitans sp.]|nr:exonuclease sbcCD subunit [Glaciihabitans sp.]